MTPSAIIFDLGNVIVDLNTEKTLAGLAALGIANPEHIFQIHQQNDLCDRHERGEISTNQFYHELQALARPNTQIDDIHNAWCHMIAGIHTSKIQLLQQLRQRYHLYALSNTNQSHVETMNQHLQQIHQIDNLNKLFDKCYFSHNVGMRKPEPRIFEYILKDSGRSMQEVVFFDDQAKNIAAASAFGIKSLLATTATLEQQLVTLDAAIP